MKLLFVFGTRPEAIKLAQVVRELSARPDFDCKVCVTGQHRELLAQFLDLFGLRSDWNLEIMRPDQDLAYLTGAASSGVTGVLASWRLDRVIVQGDTTTTFAGALAESYHRIPVAHVGAGLRTDNIYAPWPEEVNRRLVSQVADLHFAPTGQTRENLLHEGIGPDRSAIRRRAGTSRAFRHPCWSGPACHPVRDRATARHRR
jgi:UDP-N-acetylglucosamine 2-epimerase (non-hydrolysing)